MKHPSCLALLVGLSGGLMKPFGALQAGAETGTGSSRWLQPLSLADSAFRWLLEGCISLCVCVCGHLWDVLTRQDSRHGGALYGLGGPSGGLELPSEVEG